MSFPFTKARVNDLKRYALHRYNENSTFLPDLFTRLKDNKGLIVVYTHLITESGDSQNLSRERFNQLLSLIDQAKSEGWLECVTYETLLDRFNVSSKGGQSDWIENMYENYGQYCKAKTL